MPNQSIANVMGQLEKCLEADSRVETGKKWKFPADFRSEVQDSLDDLETANEEIPTTESARRTASDKLKEDYPLADQYVHSVYNRIKGLSLGGSTLPLLVAYGFAAGELGDFDQDRYRKMLGQFITTSADFANENSPNYNEEAVLPAMWITELDNLKRRLGLNEVLSAIGSRADLVTLRDKKLEAARDVLSRIWHYLSYALPERDQDPLMHNYGFKRRRDAGENAGEDDSAPDNPTPDTNPTT